jgi:hypothetical protein
MPEGFRYSSETNSAWLDAERIKRLVEPFEQEYAAGRIDA